MAVGPGRESPGLLGTCPFRGAGGEVGGRRGGWGGLGALPAEAGGGRRPILIVRTPLLMAFSHHLVFSSPSVTGDTDSCSSNVVTGSRSTHAPRMEQGLWRPLGGARPPSRVSYSRSSLLGGTDAERDKGSHGEGLGHLFFGGRKGEGFHHTDYHVFQWGPMWQILYWCLIRKLHTR